MFSGNHTKESIEKMKNHPFCKEIVQFSGTGKLINRYKSISEASRVTKITRKTILRALRTPNGPRIGKGYIWAYKSDFSPTDYLRLLREALITSGTTGIKGK